MRLNLFSIKGSMVRLFHLRFCSAALLSFFIAAQGISAPSALADEENSDIYTTYSTEKNGCAANIDQLIIFSKTSIKGPNFFCELSEATPAGSGMVNHEAVCTIDGEVVNDFVDFDLGNYEDHFEVGLPGWDNWTSMFPCTEVKGLKR